MRERLRALGLESFVKTTGGKGLHVVVPLKPTRGLGRGQGLRRVARGGDGGRLRRTATRRRSPSRSATGRIFVDYLRNGRGATAVAAYSTRARAGAPVATPLAWDELPSLRAGNAYRVGTLLARLDHLPADPWAAMDDMARPLPKGSGRKAKKD